MGHLIADYTAWALLIVGGHMMTYSCWILCRLSHWFSSTDNMSVAILKVKLHAPVTRYLKNPYIFPQNGSWSRNWNLQVLTKIVVYFSDLFSVLRKHIYCIYLQNNTKHSRLPYTFEQMKTNILYKNTTF